jgi:PAS domain-containing protein
MTHYRVEHRVRRDDGRLMWIVSTGRVVEREPGGRARRMVGTNRDITERKQAQLLLDGQREVLEWVARGTPLAQSLHRLAEVASRHADGEMLVAILVTAAGGRSLTAVAAPGMPEALVQALEHGPIADDGGLAGRAVHTRAPVLVDDLGQPGAGSTTALGEQAPPLGWHTGWAAPILDAPDHALGALVMLFRRREPRHAAWAPMVQTLTQTAAIAIRHDATLSALQHSAQTLQRTFDHMDQGISIVDDEQRLVGSNRRFRELLALPEALCQPGVAAEAVFRFNAQRGDYGPGEVERLVQERLHRAARRQAHRFEREGPGGVVIEVCGQPLPDGGFVTTYTDVTQRAQRSI